MTIEADFGSIILEPGLLGDVLASLEEHGYSGALACVLLAGGLL